MNDGQNAFDQSVTINLITYDSIQKITTGQGDDYTTGCLLDYNYFRIHNKMITINLRKQLTLDNDSKTMQQLNCTGNLEREGNANTTKFFKRNCFNLFTSYCKTILVLRFACFNIK